MKLLLVLNLFFLCSVNSAFAQATEKPMKVATKALIETGKLPPGFTSEEVVKPNIRGTQLGNRLNNLTRQKLRDWKKLVLESGEYNHLSDDKRAFALSEPAKFLEVSYLVEIQEVKAIYQNGKLVGYVLESADHVQAAIYQDGAGINFYTDEELKIVAEEAWSA